MTAPVIDPLPSPDVFWSEIFPRQEVVVWRAAASDLELVRASRRGSAALAALLTSRAGERPVHVTTAPPSARGKLGFSVESWADWSRYTTSLGELASDLVRESERPTGRCLYSQAMPVDLLPELADLTPFWFRDAARMHSTSTQLWMGGGGQRLAIHQDATHSVICLVSGRKEFLLFPPDQHFNLYTGPQQQLFKYPWRSVVDPLDFDPRAHPRFDEALAASRLVHLEAGDVMFLPAGWWHGVDSHDFNVMFNTRWLDFDAESFDNASASFAHAFLAARALDAPAKAAFRAELARTAFSRKPGPLTAGERERFLGELRAIASDAPTGEPGWDEPLVVAQEIEIALGRGGAIVGGPAGTHLLPWAYFPLLRAFAAPERPRVALGLLRCEFDVEEEPFMTEVRALHAAGALVGAPRELTTRCTPASAIAHVALSTAELPLHHRDAIERWIDIYGFGTEGDPYPYLTPDRQGVLGAAPSAEAVRGLERIVRGTLRARYRRELVRGSPAGVEYVVREARRCELASDGLGFVGPTSGAQTITWDHLEVLALFAEPRTLDDAFELVSRSFSTTRSVFDELVASWVSDGLLVERPRGPAISAPRTEPAASMYHPSSLMNVPLVERAFTDARFRHVTRGIDNRWLYDRHITLAPSGFRPFAGCVYHGARSRLAAWLPNRAGSARPFNPKDQLVREVWVAAHDYVHAWTYALVRELAPELGLCEAPITEKNVEAFAFAHLVTEAAATIGFDYWHLSLIELDRACPIGTRTPNFSTGYRQSSVAEFRRANPRFDPQRPEFLTEIVDAYCSGRISGFSVADALESPLLDHWISHELIYSSRQRRYIRRWLAHIAGDPSIAGDADRPLAADAPWQRALLARAGEAVHAFVKSGEPHAIDLVAPDRAWRTPASVRSDPRFTNLNLLERDDVARMCERPMCLEDSQLVFDQFLASFDYDAFDADKLPALASLRRIGDVPSLVALTRKERRLDPHPDEPTDFLFYA
jgi:hypothetical protein